MNLLRWILLGEAVVIAALVIVLLLVLIWNLLRKRVVTVPSITLTVEKNQYDHGETVNVSGIVTKDVGVPAVGETVDLKLTDSASTEFPVGTTTTDADGKYTASFPVPDAVAPGGVTVTATDTALGVSATATFTFKRSKVRERWKKLKEWKERNLYKQRRNPFSWCVWLTLRFGRLKRTLTLNGKPLEDGERT